MKILNLYAGVGGNRKFWTNCEVTAIENNPEIAAIYKELYPDDHVLAGDAHEFLLNNFQKYDFIWSSPPCQSHSQVRYGLGFKATGKVKPLYPDMKLYQEIILLQKWFKGKWVVENTIPYYEPLMPGQRLAGHIFWANFRIPVFYAKGKAHGGTLAELQKRKGVDLSGYKLKNKQQILRNCVEPETGAHILMSAFEDKNMSAIKRQSFEQKEFKVSQVDELKDQ